MTCAWTGREAFGAMMYNPSTARMLGGIAGRQRRIESQAGKGHSGAAHSIGSAIAAQTMKMRDDLLMKLRLQAGGLLYDPNDGRIAESMPNPPRTWPRQASSERSPCHAHMKTRRLKTRRASIPQLFKNPGTLYRAQRARDSLTTNGNQRGTKRNNVPDSHHTVQDACALTQAPDIGCEKGMESNAGIWPLPSLGRLVNSKQVRAHSLPAAHTR